MNIRYQVRNMGFFLKCASQCKRKSRIFYNSCWAMGIFGMSKKVSYKYDMFKIGTFYVTLRAIVRFFFLQRFFGPLAQNSFVNLVLYTQVIVICMGLPKNIIYLCIDYFIFLYCMHKILPLLWFFVKVRTKWRKGPLTQKIM